MRLFILLIFSFAIVGLFTLFPEIASQTLRIEAFGWIFETRQGAFMTALIVLLALVWMIQRLFAAILAGPGQLLRTLRMGNKKRAEQRLRKGIADLIDMRDDHGRKAFRSASGVMPDWATTLLKTLTMPPSEQQLLEKSGLERGGDPLVIALAARIASDPEAASTPDLSTRRAHLEAWLAVHPDAPLAIDRLTAIAEEEGDWPLAVQLLEQAWKQGHRSAASIKPRLATAYIQLAGEDGENRQMLLRKAQRLDPDNAEVALAIGRTHLADNNPEAAQKLWLEHLERNNDFNVAAALLELFKADALAAFRKLDKSNAERTYLPAKRWLQASLAKRAGLTGLATEITDQLLKKAAAPEVLRSKGDWHAEAGEWEKAASYYQRLCSKGSKPSASAAK